MKKFVALFRGINVGGRNKLPMRELAEILEELGLKSTKTYIQSGNVVFQSEAQNIEDISGRITNAIYDSHGFSTKVFILQLEALENAISSNPFPEAENMPKALHLYFLSSEPKNPDIETLEMLKLDSERYKIVDKVFYLYAPDGIGRSKLAARAEKALGVTVTARNWRTVSKISEIAR